MVVNSFPPEALWEMLSFNVTEEMLDPRPGDKKLTQAQAGLVTGHEQSICLARWRRVKALHIWAHKKEQVRVGVLGCVSVV